MIFTMSLDALIWDFFDFLDMSLPGKKCLCLFWVPGVGGGGKAAAWGGGVGEGWGLGRGWGVGEAQGMGY